MKTTTRKTADGKPDLARVPDVTDPKATEEWHAALVEAMAENVANLIRLAKLEQAAIEAAQRADVPPVTDCKPDFVLPFGGAQNPAAVWLHNLIHFFGMLDGREPFLVGTGVGRGGS